MQSTASAGLGLGRSRAISVTDTASILTLHSVPPSPARRQGSQERHARAANLSATTSNNPSSVWQQPDLPSWLDRSPSRSRTSESRSRSTSPRQREGRASMGQRSDAQGDSRRERIIREGSSRAVPAIPRDAGSKHTNHGRSQSRNTNTSSSRPTPSPKPSKTSPCVPPAQAAAKSSDASHRSIPPHLPNLSNAPHSAAKPDIPPTFTIDLSLPPSQRYNHIAPYFSAHAHLLPELLTQISREIFGWDAEKGKRWGRRLFRRVPSREEMEEIEGISRVWGVEKYVLVAFNVLLDTFMGCTSGGVRVRDGDGVDVGTAIEKGEEESEEGLAQRKINDSSTFETTENGNARDNNDNMALPSLHDPTSDVRGRMLHFRTLDWGMPELRQLVCQYEYVACPGSPVLARTITYFGFVGVLTGVRKSLSVSLNFRPCHNAGSLFAKMRFRCHQILVLLGYRQPIASILRECLLPGRYDPRRILPSLHEVERMMPGRRSTAAYLIFSDGARTTTMEKNLKSAVVRSASDFIVAGNHDVADEVTEVAKNRGGGGKDDGGCQRERNSGSPMLRTNAANMHYMSFGEGGTVCAADAEEARMTGIEDPRKTMVADQQRTSANEALPKELADKLGMNMLIADSQLRKRCMAGYWREARARARALAPVEGDTAAAGAERGRRALAEMKNTGAPEEGRVGGGPAVRTGDVLRWLEDVRICNEETHYAVIMDPLRGEIVWIRRWIEPRRC